MSHPRPSRLVRIAVALAITGIVSFAIALVMDLDGDGLMTVQEWSRGASPLDADSDGDGLDDRAEVLAGLPPDDRDADDDGLVDALDGAPRAPDQDGDGVLDGFEGNPLCILWTDCDGDGLADGDEAPRFDPLNGDTFGAGLSDAVVKAFDDAGQPADADRDADGIPDAWENVDGLIDWGGFDPEPGRKDLLLEYLKVTGPESSRYALDMTDAYDAVAQMFLERDIHVQWVETQVSLNQEVRPGFLGGDDLPFYREVLAAGQGSQNPYVTTVVLNPQQTQEDLSGNVLGAAFLRSMIATVDYGSHVDIVFREADSDGLTLSNGEITLSPSIESHILGAPREQIRQLRFGSEGIVNLGETQNGVFLVTREGGTDFRWDWQNDWFATAPNITVDGAYLQLRATGAILYDGTLAQTIVHELGHTLGLCHTHEQDCFADLAPHEQNRAAVDSSSMSYTAPPGTLHFLDSEWGQLEDYIACPPQAPVALVAIQASPEVIRQSKYESSFMQEQSIRECGEAAVLESNMEPDDGVDPTGGNGYGALTLYILVTLVVAGAVTWRIR